MKKLSMNKRGAHGYQIDEESTLMALCCVNVDKLESNAPEFSSLYNSGSGLDTYLV